MSLLSGLGGMLGNLLDQYGGPQAVATQVLNQLGGVQGVLAKLQQAGLGGQVSSWLGNGSNEPVSPEQVGAALGHGPLAEIAAKFGLTPDQLNEAIAHTLPGLIDKISPNGQVQPHLLDGGAAQGGSPLNVPS